jgi:hypothetical protein
MSQARRRPHLSPDHRAAADVQERALLQNEADARGYGVTGLARMIIERALQDDLVGHEVTPGTGMPPIIRRWT